MLDRFGRQMFSPNLSQRNQKMGYAVFLDQIELSESLFPFFSPGHIGQKSRSYLYSIGGGGMAELSASALADDTLAGAADVRPRASRGCHRADCR